MIYKRGNSYHMKQHRRRASLVGKLMAKDPTLCSYQALALANQMLKSKKGFGKRSNK